MGVKYRRLPGKTGVLAGMEITSQLVCLVHSVITVFRSVQTGETKFDSITLKSWVCQSYIYNSKTFALRVFNEAF